MARNEEPREVNRESNSGSTQSHGSSDLSSTQSRKGETNRGQAGEDMDGRPHADQNRSGGKGSVSQQSNADTDGGAPSRQTSTASEEKGQL